MICAKNAGFKCLEVESHSALVVSQLQQYCPSREVNDLVLNDIRHLAPSFELLSFSYIPRSCNVIADKLSKWALHLPLNCLILEEVPSCIALDVVAEVSSS